MKPSEYLDKCKIALQVQSDYALAKGLGLPKQRISDIYKGKIYPDAYAAAKIALCLHLDPLEVIADMEAQTAKSEEKRSFWQGFLSRSGKAAAALLLALHLLTSFTTGGGVLAGGKGLTNSWISGLFRRRSFA